MRFGDHHVHANLLSGSAICVVIVSGFWAALLLPGFSSGWGTRLLLAGGLIVPVLGAVLAVLSYSGAGKLRRWVVAAAAANVAFLAAYWIFVLD